MYSEQVLIDRIKAQTGYTRVELADDNITDFSGETLTDSTPRIFVGHVGIRLKHPDQVWRNGYEELENDLMLVSTIQVLCTRSSFPTVRTAVANSYKNWSPFGTAESNYSNIVFLENKIVAKVSNNLWFEEFIGLIFPQLV